MTIVIAKHQKRGSRWLSYVEPLPFGAWPLWPSRHFRLWSLMSLKQMWLSLQRLKLKTL